MTARRLWLAIVALMWCLPFWCLPIWCPTAAAGEPGLDWRPIGASDSKIRLGQRRAGEGVHYFTTQTDGYEVSLYFARVPSTDYRLDRVFVLYADLAPGRYFPMKYDVAQILDWKEVVASGAARSDSFTVVAGPGVYDVITFTAEGDVPCAVFANTWSRSKNDATGAGSRRIFGYLCMERGSGLDRSRIGAALGALTVVD